MTLTTKALEIRLEMAISDKVIAENNIRKINKQLLIISEDSS